jgi:hypothetical protein
VTSTRSPGTQPSTADPSGDSAEIQPLRRVAITRERQRVGGRLALRFEDGDSTTDHRLLGPVDPLGRIENGRKHVQPPCSLDDREVDDVIGKFSGK